MRNFHEIKHDRYYAGSHYPTPRHDVSALVICPGCATEQRDDDGDPIHISTEIFSGYKAKSITCFNCGIVFGATREDKEAFDGDV